MKKNNFSPPDNLAEYVTEYIASKIINLELKPGERILEANLADELNMSRGPIRDSLKILERRWLVEILPRKGAKVAELDEDHVKNIFDVIFELYSIFVRK